MKWLSDQAVHRLRGGQTSAGRWPATGQRPSAGSGPAEAPDLSGTRYRLLEPLGRGGMGSVYLVEDTTLGRRLALKVLDLPDAAGELAARMLREARIMAGLEHPGIVPVHDAGTLADGRAFYTMKFVEGRRLDQLLGPATAIPERLRIFQKVCEAVAFAHAHGVLHRDLKPENIMAGPFGEVLVMDWGVAKILRGVRVGKEPAASRNAGAPPQPEPGTAYGAVLGTPGYMAPEQARGENDRLDQRADVYSLGAILRFLLTGDSPEESTTAAPTGGRAPGPEREALRRDRGRMPRALAAVGAKAMARDPLNRYASVPDLAAEVARYLDGLPLIAYSESLWERAQRLFARHRTAILLVLAYLLMRALLIFFANH